MEIVDTSLRERVIEALVVFAVLFVTGYLQNTYDWTSLLVVPVAFFVLGMAIDVVRARFVR